jgi:hypothetical protein
MHLVVTAISSIAFSIDHPAFCDSYLGQRYMFHHVKLNIHSYYHYSSGIYFTNGDTFDLEHLHPLANSHMTLTIIMVLVIDIG